MRSLARRRQSLDPLEERLTRAVFRTKPRVWFHGREIRSIGYVNTWPDRVDRFPHNTSGQPNGLIRASGPTTGRPGVDFDGGNDRLDGPVGFAHTGTAHTLIVVGDQRGSGSLKYLLDAHSGRLIFAQRGNGSYPSWYDGSWKDATSYPAINGPQILEFALDPVALSGVIVRNGETVKAGAYSPKALNGTVRWMTHYDGSTTSAAAAQVGELIYWDRVLSARERRALRLLLAPMYGVRLLGDA